MRCSDGLEPIPCQWLDLIPAVEASDLVLDVLQVARKRGRVPANFNPVPDVDRPEDDAKVPVWLEPPDALRFIEHADKEGVGDYARLYLFTGLRLNEGLGLRVGDVDLDEGIIRVHKHSKRRSLKTASARRLVPIWPKLRSTLERLTVGKGPEQLLFPDEDGAKLEDLPRDPWNRAAVAAGVNEVEDDGSVKRFTPHGARHTYISQRYQCTDGGKPIADFTIYTEVGHHDESLCRDRYGHVATKRVRVEGFDYELPKDTSRIQAAESPARKRRKVAVVMS